MHGFNVKGQTAQDQVCCLLTTIKAFKTIDSNLKILKFHSVYYFSLVQFGLSDYHSFAACDVCLKRLKATFCFCSNVTAFVFCFLVANVSLMQKAECNLKKPYHSVLNMLSLSVLTLPYHVYLSS